MNFYVIELMGRIVRPHGWYDRLMMWLGVNTRPFVSTSEHVAYDSVQAAMNEGNRLAGQRLKWDVDQAKSYVAVSNEYRWVSDAGDVLESYVRIKRHTLSPRTPQAQPQMRRNGKGHN
jgi:hypothetical protein